MRSARAQISFRSRNERACAVTDPLFIPSPDALGPARAARGAVVQLSQFAAPDCRLVATGREAVTQAAARRDPKGTTFAVDTARALMLQACRASPDPRRRRTGASGGIQREVTDG